MDELVNERFSIEVMSTLEGPDESRKLVYYAFSVKHLVVGAGETVGEAVMAFLEGLRKKHGELVD